MKTAFKLVEEAVAGMSGGGLVLMNGPEVSCACKSGDIGLCGVIEPDCQVALQLPGNTPGEIVLVPMSWPVGKTAGVES